MAASAIGVDYQVVNGQHHFVFDNGEGLLFGTLGEAVQFAQQIETRENAQRALIARALKISPTMSNQAAFEGKTATVDTNNNIIIQITGG